jgi:hypothetical protein
MPAVAVGWAGALAVFFIGWLDEGPCHGRSFFARGQILGAVFNQLVRSCTQLLFLE